MVKVWFGMLAAALLGAVVTTTLPFQDSVVFWLVLVIVALGSAAFGVRRRSVLPLFPCAALVLSMALMSVSQPLQLIYMAQKIEGLPQGTITLKQVQQELRARGIIVAYDSSALAKTVRLPHGSQRLSEVLSVIERQTGLRHSPGVVCGTGVPLVWYPQRIQVDHVSNEPA
ncbi:MAG: hypothetical protein ACREAA_20750 [Candidatus Polarisedimenticolia bacterium]